MSFKPSDEKYNGIWGTRMPRFTTLYSGSSGNAGVIEQDGSYLLVDMGASCRSTMAGLAAIGLEISGLKGILVTHEHSDHIRGLNVFLKRVPVPVYAGIATLEALWQMDAVPESTELIAVDGRSEDIEGFEVTGFPTSHDAAGCCGYRVKTPSGAVMAIATDLGLITDDVMTYLQNAALVALEANYDRDKLYKGRYPYYLKKRIDSPRGHLCNDVSAATVARLIKEGCNRVALCHLSAENNHPDLVRTAIEQALFASGQQLPPEGIVQISRRYEPSDWMDF